MINSDKTSMFESTMKWVEPRNEWHMEIMGRTIQEFKLSWWPIEVVKKLLNCPRVDIFFKGLNKKKVKRYRVTIEEIDEADLL